MENKSYNVKEVAKILGIHHQTVLDRIHRQELFGYKEGNEWRVTEKAIEEYRGDKMPKVREFLLNVSSDPRELEKLLESKKPIKGLKPVPSGNCRVKCLWGGWCWTISTQGHKSYTLLFHDETKKDGKGRLVVPEILNDEMAEDMLCRMLIRKCLDCHFGNLRKKKLLMDQEKITVKKIVEDWQKWCNEGKRSYYKYPQETIKWENEIIACIKDMPAIDVDANVLQDIAKPAWKKIGEEKRKKSGSPGGGNIIERLKKVSTLWNWIIKRKSKYGIRDNPVENWLYPLVKSRGEQEPPTVEEYLQLLRGAQQHCSFMVNVILAGSTTGRRENEFQTLEWTDIDWDEEHIDQEGFAPMLVIRGENYKDGRKGDPPEYVPVNPLLYEILLKQKENSNGCKLVFNHRLRNNPKNSLVEIDICDYMAKVSWKAGLKRTINFHLLRHGFITMLYDAGVEERLIQILVSHKIGSRITREVYYHPNKKLDAQKGAREAWKVIKERLNLGKILDETKLLQG